MDCGICKEKVKWTQTSRNADFELRCWNCDAKYGDGESGEFFDQKWAADEIRRLREDNERLRAILEDATPPERIPCAAAAWPY